MEVNDYFHDGGELSACVVEEGPFSLGNLRFFKNEFSFAFYRGDCTKTPV